MKIKKFVLIILFTLLFLASCGSGNSDISDPDAILANILKSYRENGMTSWWEILAVYDADENPMDYKGYDEVLYSLEGDTTAKMASYVLVTNISVIIGADEGYFEYCGPYKEKLKTILENPAENYTVNDYIFAYFALKTSGMPFDPEPFFDYLANAQKAGGGFSLPGDPEDSQMTAFAVTALNLICSYSESGTAFNTSVFDAAVKFLEDSACENASSAAAVLSALSGQYEKSGLLQKISDRLMLFKVSGEAGYSFLEGEKSNAPATAQAAIALSDYKNNIPVWEKLYLESLEAFGEEE